MAEAAENPTPTEEFPRRFGRFTLLQVLGQGGMGRVYRAWLEGPGSFRKMVAVKILHTRERDPENARIVRASIRNEARIGALLRHPGVVEVYDYGIEEDLPWISMEVVDGVDLELILRKCSPLPASALLDLGLQLCSALDYAHDFSDGKVKVHLVHRDLKPANIIVDRFGRAKITDFGIARSTLATGVTTASGVMKGTPTFMAPEQILGKGIDARTDLFAIGAILYEAATGRRLLRRDGVAATVAAVLAVDELTAKGSGFDEVNDRVPGLAEVLRRCLAKDPSRRYSAASELADELMTLLVSNPRTMRGTRDGLSTLVARLGGNDQWLRSTADPTREVTPSNVFARTPTDILLAQLGLRAHPGDTSPAVGRIRLVSQTSPRAMVRRPARTLSERLPPLRARGPEALMVVLVALLLGMSGASNGDAETPLSEPAPYNGVFVEEPRLALVSAPPPRRAARPAPVSSKASAPAAQVARAAEVAPGVEVTSKPQSAPAPSIVRSEAVHRRVIGRVRPGTSRSFIVEAQGLDLAHVRLYTRSGSQGAWAHRALSEVAAGYWGTVIQFPTEAIGSTDYWFEVQPVDGSAYSLDDGGQPWTVTVAP